MGEGAPRRRRARATPPPTPAPAAYPLARGGGGERGEGQTLRRRRRARGGDQSARPLRRRIVVAAVVAGQKKKKIVFVFAGGRSSSSLGWRWWQKGRGHRLLLGPSGAKAGRKKPGGKRQKVCSPPSCVESARAWEAQKKRPLERGDEEAHVGAGDDDEHGARHWRVDPLSMEEAEADPTGDWTSFCGPPPRALVQRGRKGKRQPLPLFPLAPKLPSGTSEVANQPRLLEGEDATGKNPRGLRGRRRSGLRVRGRNRQIDPPGQSESRGGEQTGRATRLHTPGLSQGSLGRFPGARSIPHAGSVRAWSGLTVGGVEGPLGATSSTSTGAIFCQSSKLKID